jgi:phosphatidate phosphatase APP1
LLDSKKGTDYKKNAIRKILQLAPEKRFLLLGDDTQNDMEVYASIISEFPDQIARIYIRKTMKKLNGSRQKQRKALDEHAGKFCYFSDEDDVQKALELIEKEYNA